MREIGWPGPEAGAEIGARELCEQGAADRDDQPGREFRGHRALGRLPYYQDVQPCAGTQR